MIKGMDMSTACNKCPFHNAYICTAKGSPVSLQIYLKDKKPFDCPLVEIPTPHDKLIDKRPIIKFIQDGLNRKYNPFGYDAVEILSEIEFAPTIIEAEE